MFGFEGTESTQEYTSLSQAELFLKITSIFLDSSMVEHTAVNRGVVGSSPTRGAECQGNWQTKEAAEAAKHLKHKAPWSSG